MSEKLRRLEIPPKSPFFVYCLTCDKTLYSPELDNSVTRNIANQTASSHATSFSENHIVFLIKNPKK